MSQFVLKCSCLLCYSHAFIISVLYLEIIFPVQINHNHFRCSPSQFTIIPLLLLFALYPGTVSTRNVRQSECCCLQYTHLVNVSHILQQFWMIDVKNGGDDSHGLVLSIKSSWFCFFFSCKHEAYNQKKKTIKKPQVCVFKLGLMCKLGPRSRLRIH